MSASTYKAQAERLAAHLVAKHGIKLKSASMLEAIAAAHGARDWNTLAASPSLPEKKPEPGRALGAQSTQLSPEEALFQEVLRTGSRDLRLDEPKNYPKRWTLDYGSPLLRAHVELSPERGRAFRDFLFSLARLAPAASRPGQLQFGRFVYEYGETQVDGLLRVHAAGAAEALVVELNEGTLVSELTRSFAAIEPFVQALTAPAAKGLFVVAGVTDSYAHHKALALASLSQGSVILNTHDYSNEQIVRVEPGGPTRELVLGELRDVPGTKNVTALLNAGQLVLATVHGNCISTALRRLEEVGMPRDVLAQHLRGVVAVKRILKSCPHCHGAGCAVCNNRGVHSATQVYEHIVLQNSREVEALIEGRVSYPTMRGAARRLVDNGEISQQEFHRVFGE